MTDTDWLLEVTVDGQVHRFASQLRLLDEDSGGTETYVYLPGLDTDGFQAPRQTDEDVGISVVAPTLADVAARLDTAPVVLRRWTDGDTVDDAEVYALGEVAGVSFGGPYDAVSFAITRQISGSLLGGSVPGPYARVDTSTWPSGGHTIGTEGAPYPVIFGYPGYTGTDPPETVVPCPIAQWAASTHATTYTVVSEDPDASISQVRVRNQGDDDEYTQTVVTTTDLLGARIRVAHCTLGGVASVPTSERASMLVGYSATSGWGGGVARSLYDVIRYVCRRWGAGDSLDLEQLATARETLELFYVDSYIDSVVSSPWTLIEDLVAYLPVQLRAGPRGRYLIARRYVSDPRRTVGSLQDEATAVRVSPYRRDGAPVNEVQGLYGSHPELGWLYNVVASGDHRLAQPAGTSAPTRTYVDSATAQRSLARYGRRANDQGPITIHWTWDQGTMIRLLEAELQRTALPALLVSVDVRAGLADAWREGDEVLWTDEAGGFDDSPAIVDAPPLVGDTTRLTLRIPQ